MLPPQLITVLYGGFEAHGLAGLRRASEDPSSPHPCGRIELIEIHFFWVLLTGDYAYKLKKPETQCQAGGFAARLQVLFLQ